MATKTKKTTDKNFIYALIVLVLVLVLIWVFKTGSRNYPSANPQQVMVQNEYPAIEDGSDLDEAVKELDSTDLNEIDRGLGDVDY